MAQVRPTGPGDRLGHPSGPPGAAAGAGGRGDPPAGSTVVGPAPDPLVELVDGHQHRPRLGALRRSDHAPLLEQVHQPAGPGEADPELALQHRRRAQLGPHHQLHGLLEQPVVVAILAAALPGTRRCRRPRRRRRTAARTGAASGPPPCGPRPRPPRRPGCGGARWCWRRSSSMSPWPMSRSAPGWSRMTRLSAREDTANASRDGMLALMTPVMTSTDGRWVAMTRWMPTARAIWAMRQIDSSTSRAATIIRSLSSSTTTRMKGSRVYWRPASPASPAAGPASSCSSPRS